MNGGNTFHPEQTRDALNMYLHGDKSAVIDIDHPDTTKYPLFQNAMSYGCFE